MESGFAYASSRSNMAMAGSPSPLLRGLETSFQVGGDQYASSEAKSSFVTLSLNT